jgi:hypothetical protein
MSEFCTSRQFPETIGKTGFNVSGTLGDSVSPVGICFTMSSSKNMPVKPYDDAENKIIKFTIFWDVSPFDLVYKY